MCVLGARVFKALRRLHTCDVHAWVPDVDRCVGRIPLKAVFYRRLPHQQSKEADSPGTFHGNKAKDVWTTRLDCVYQEYYATVAKVCEVLELEVDEGKFQGRDADEVWCDGFTYDMELGLMGKGSPASHSNYSWPCWKDKVGSYPMFRRQF
jgi:hypothetical protein